MTIATGREGQMYLRTLGQLELEGGSFRQSRSLLLLAYLTLEGPTPRRQLAELLWPDAAAPLNSLSVTLTKLRRLNVIGADDLRVWPTVRCDVHDLKAALLAGDVDQVAALHTEAFLSGSAGEPGAEFEEWALRVREHLAGQVRSTLLDAATRAAAHGQFDTAAGQALHAYGVLGAAPLDGAELVQLATLLTAAQHPDREVVLQECRDLDVTVPSSPEAARAQLRRTLLGRSGELERLLGLNLGEWAWVRGGPGMGKTSLLRELAAKSGWLYLLARNGLPYATLEGLTDQLEGGEEQVLRRLVQNRRDFILDDWHEADEESRRLLARLRALQPACRVVLAGPDTAPVRVGTLIELGPLGEDVLATYPGAYAATDGVPALVGAWLRSEPLTTVLESRLDDLPQGARRVYLALTLLDEPDLTLVRQALALDARQMSQAMAALLAAGLIQGSGRPYARKAADHALRSRPDELAGLCLALARELPELPALPFYQQSRVLWEADDRSRIHGAYLKAAQVMLRRGFPARAAVLLREAPPSGEVTLQLGRALERAGEYREAMTVIGELPESHEVLALKSTILWRLGRPLEARQAAERALNGQPADRAEGLTTLGSLALSQGDHAEAQTHYRRATVLWASIGEEERRLRALSNQALARSEAGEDAEVAFQEILSAAQDSPVLRAMTLINLGCAHQRHAAPAPAERAFREAILLAEEWQATSLLVSALTNLGALLHVQGRLDEARATYERGLTLSRQPGEQLFTAMLLTNLAELTEDREAMEEAMLLLEAGGHTAQLAHAREIYRRFRAVSGAAVHP